MSSYTAALLLMHLEKLHIYSTVITHKTKEASLTPDTWDTVSPKKKYTLLSSWVLKSERGQMESKGCTTHSSELMGVTHRLLFL